MKTIGIIGGMSWESSQEYYRIINETVRDCLGGLHSAQCLMYSVDFGELEPLQHDAEGWNQAAVTLAQAAQRLEAGGAQCIVLATNTFHKVADSIQASVAIPLLHIVDATARQIRSQGIHTIGLLGTRYTMEEDFYIDRLEKMFEINVLVPDQAGRDLVNRVIFDELCLGKVLQPSRDRYREIIAGLVERGAQGIVFGCTEIGLLVTEEDSPVPVFDTTRIHAQTAVEWALAGNNPTHSQVS